MFMRTITELSQYQTPRLVTVCAVGFLRQSDLGLRRFLLTPMDSLPPERILLLRTIMFGLATIVSRLDLEPTMSIS